MAIQIISHMQTFTNTGWLRFVGSLKLYVIFAKERYKRDYILQKRPAILRSLLIIATPYANIYKHLQTSMGWQRFVVYISC